KEEDGGKDGVGEEAQRPGKKEEHHQDHCGRGQMGPLTAAACRVYHGGLGRAAVDDEGAAAACGSVCKREPNQIQILAEVVAVTESVGARGGSALSQDDDEAG